ncbi:hypothetical protein Y900_028325 [Mycolicibacterium aromaticivorans JS19b1 = JCM 16368]|uniref:Uncharacterized protein n=1 Tax=Mycolicibacterium aromaticivorans JS19b1 = JCM 16368 TaxID=1440774 RepID=A0A064CBW9_9MYCO|nr:hypothetical protein [Mycolicibacterium aromaticivorans]KDE97181.1 hypothetical protein Y900_028325 [Mycolicibacterium aromaticivorans JS19b1 = JCM 16368]
MTESRAHHRAIVHAAALSTNPALACARTDLHTAVRADDEHHRRQYALSARDSAGEVLLEPKSTPLERDYARRYFEDADAMIAKPTAMTAAWRQS